jgi:hypothetical protein
LVLMAANSKRTCSGTNKRGEPCGATAGSDGLCSVHSGRTDPKELGRKGGLASVRSRLGISPQVVDDQLRGLARKQLEALLSDPDPRVRLSASRALYSYSPTTPPGVPVPTNDPMLGSVRDRLIDRIAGLSARAEKPVEQAARLEAENQRLRARVRELELDSPSRASVDVRVPEQPTFWNPVRPPADGAGDSEVS